MCGEGAELGARGAQPARLGSPDAYETTRVGEGEGLEEHPVHDAEHRRGGADGKRHGDRHGE